MSGSRTLARSCVVWPPPTLGRTRPCTLPPGNLCLTARCRAVPAGEWEALEGELKETKSSLAELQVGGWDDLSNGASTPLLVVVLIGRMGPAHL